MQTMMYWVSRLEPLVRLESDREIIIIFANRTGREDEITYAGTSAVIGIKDGEVLVYGVLGRGDKELLVVDTDEPPFARLVHTTHNPAIPSGAQDPQEPDDSGSSDIGSSRGGESNQFDEEAGKPPVEPLPNARQPSNSEHEGQASRSASNYDGDPGNSDPESFDRDPSELRSHNQSSLENIDLLGRYLDEQPSRVSSSNGYLNSHTNQEYDRKSSVGKTPDSLRARRGSGSDLDLRPQESSLSTRKPTWGQLPPRTDRDVGPRWTVSDDDENSNVGGDDDISDGYWSSEIDESNWGPENRHSLRSDVSVWNNFPGETKSAEGPSTPRSQMITQKVEDYLRGSTPRSESQQDVSRFTEPTPVRNPEIRSRQQTSSRVRGYGVSETNSNGRKQSGLNRQIRSTDDANSTGSARGSSLGYSAKAAGEPTSKGRDSRTLTQARPSSSAKVNISSAIHNVASTRATSIPVALNRDLGREPSLGRRPPSAPVQAEISVLRPASRSRLQERNDSTRGRAAEAPLTKAVKSNTDPMVVSASGQKEARQLSRGRQRGTRSALDQHQQPRHGPPRTSQSAQNNRRTSVEPVDLSQFHLIEEFPSANCPVHGSRSRSAARHGTGGGSRRRPSTDGRRRPGSRDVRESRLATQNTPAQQTGSVPGPVSISSKRVASAPRRKPSKDLKPSRRMTQSAQVGIAEPKRHGGVTFGDDIVRTEVTRLDLKHGPKTPVAMVLVGEREHGSRKLGVAEAPRDSLFGIKGTNMQPARPRSAVW